MSLSYVLNVTLCQTFDHQPLATVNGLPGDGAELRPPQLRALAAQLCRIADDAEDQPMGPRHYRPKRRDYPLNPFKP
ncbi:MAG TPA: hypothetical protein VFL54_09060 [Gammaproteobacteria bacterium]|nr:hypothetical protein [Gammaproteobacteria bacterium]